MLTYTRLQLNETWFKNIKKRLCITTKLHTKLVTLYEYQKEAYFLSTGLGLIVVKLWKHVIFKIK